GSASIPATVTSGGLNATLTAHPKAAALFAMGYLPIPLPHLDVFAKAGAARLKSSVNASAQATCPIGVACLIPIFIPPYSASSSDTNFAYGAGVQVKLASLAVPAEYERMHSRRGGRCRAGSSAPASAGWRGACADSPCTARPRRADLGAGPAASPAAPRYP